MLGRIRQQFNQWFEDTAPGLPVYWWQPKNSLRNFGDELNPAVIQALVGKKPRHATPQDTKLLAIGSVLHFATPNDHVWGSGVNGKNLDPNEYVSQLAAVYAVRGPLTQEFLKKKSIDCPEVYGDPGLLIPQLYHLSRGEPTQDYVVIPHLSELEDLPHDPHHVYPTEPWLQIYEKIRSAQLVISSSLHGLVLAEALGIPARHLRISDIEPPFKYEDYYLGSGRSSFSSARSVSEALDLGGEAPVKWDPEPLLAAFPRHLFSN